MFGEVPQTQSPLGKHLILEKRAPDKKVCAFRDQERRGDREEALRDKAWGLCRSDPNIQLKDYRSRIGPTLFGNIAVRVPRLVDTSTGSRVDLIADCGGKDPDGLPIRLARLGAWMRYRYPARFLADLFPFAGKAHPERIRRANLAVAAILHSIPDVVESSEKFDLGLDTTFLLTSAFSKGHNNEVLIGHGKTDRASARSWAHCSPMEIIRANVCALVWIASGEQRKHRSKIGNRLPASSRA